MRSGAAARENGASDAAHQTLLAIDPGSRVIGYAFFRRGELADAGLILPPRVRDPALVRLTAMLGELLVLVDRCRPAVAVVEMPSVGVARSRRTIGGHGLTVLGVAAGAVWAALMQHLPIGAVCTVDPHVWTRGRKKERRARLMAAGTPGYMGERDRGRDAADAIQIGYAWIARGRRE